MTLRAYKPAHEFSEPISQWTKAPIKRYARLQGGFAFKSEIFSSNGVPVVRMNNLKRGNIDLTDVARVPQEETVAAFALREADLLIGMSGSIGQTGSLGNFAVVKRSDLPCQLNQRVGRFISVSEELYYPYLRWVVQSKIFSDSIILNSTGTAQFNVSSEQIGQISAPLPPPDVQVAIVDFLDRETVKVDELLLKQIEFLDRLNEHRRAEVTHLVTRGIDSDSTTTESGKTNLGRVSAHWTVCRVKTVLSKIEQGWSPQCESRAAESDEWGVLKVGCVNGTHFDESENKALPTELVPHEPLEVRSGDILMSRANTIELAGSISLVGNVRPRLMLCDKLYRLTFHPEQVDPRFIVYCLASPVGRQPLEASATGASPSMKNISQDSVKDIWIALPSQTEQRKIADFLDKRGAAIHQLKHATLSMMDRLRERRSALITSAVTGQIDVRQPSLSGLAA
jgi:type I restriction enzyme S subunit